MLLGRLFEVRAAQELALEITQAQSTQEALPPSMATEAQPPAQSQQTPTMPFIGEVVDFAPGQSILVERCLSLAQDLYLADHAFIYAPGVKPLAECLPVLPMTVGMEIMAEVAACLAPGYGLIGFEDVEATRWIGLEDTDTLTLRVTAQVNRFDPGRCLYAIGVAICVAGTTTPSIRATVLFGERYLIELPLAFTELEEAHRYPLTAEQIYVQRRLFHGPSLQCLTGEIVLGRQGVVGELVIRSPAELFHSVPHPQLLTDPALLDAVGQLIGIWAMEGERYVFPTGIKKLELYCPTPPVETRVPVRVEITEVVAKTLRASVEIQDGSGAVWMRIKDWVDWRFRWHRQLVDFRRAPSRCLLSHTIKLPTLNPRAVCQMLSSAALRDFDMGLVARSYLDPEEMGLFSAMAKNPQRQQQWLLGRIAAKDAVRYWLARQQQREEMLHPAAFRIENDERGRPLVQGFSEASAAPQVSIAHCEDRAIAIAHGDAVGVDIERIVERDAAFLETFTTPREQVLLLDFSESERHGWIVRLWCAKEAVGKLLGVGVEGAQALEATAISIEGTITIHERKGGRRLLVNTLEDDDFIIAYAIAPWAGPEARSELQSAIISQSKS